MKKINSSSVVEIWSSHYLNYVDERSEKDTNIKLLQVERGSAPGEYIVEFIRLRKGD